MDQSIKRNHYTNNADAMIQALDNTGIRMFMYFPQKKMITVPENTCAAYQCKAVYTDMPHSFAEDYVYIEDYPVFKEMYYQIDRGEKTATAVFHSKDLNYCNHVTLTTVSWTKEGLPDEVFGLIEDLSENYKSNQLVQKLQEKLADTVTGDDGVHEAVNLIADTISEAYITIYHIWLIDFTYICFQDTAIKYMAASENRIPCDRRQIKKYITDWTESEFHEVLQEFFDLDTLGKRLKNTEKITCVYRRKKFGWTKGQYTVAKRDLDGNVTNVIFTVRDINEEVEREEKKKRAIYEIQHDPLTKAYNRNGFDNLTKKSSIEKRSLGFAIIDIDDFKSLNDNYGHEAGDQVLKQVAKSLTEAFRNGDYIVRLGGDEFAVFLNNSTEDIWRLFCRKQQYIHRSLHEHFPQMQNITLSIGLCFSKIGYYDDLYALADEALYETKRNGRSGSTLISKDHKILKRWRDEHFTLQTETALDRSTTGVYRIEFSKNLEEQPQMYCNEMTKQILGVSANADTFKCYEAWIAGIDPSYITAIKETREIMMNEGQAECTYLWNHPQWGKIYVRTGGSGIRENGVLIIHGYHHALKNIKIVEREDDSEQLIAALNNIYFASYYLNLEDNTYSTFKIAPGEEHLQMQDKTISEILTEFTNVLVAPQDREKMVAFVNMETLQKRIELDKTIDCEYRSQVTKGWCHARFVAVKYDQDGKLTHVLFTIGKLDQAKSKEMDEITHRSEKFCLLKKQLFLEAVLKACDQLCYEYDPQMHTLECLSDDNDTKLPQKIDYFPESMREYSFIHPQDVENFIRTIKTIDGNNTVQCDVRCLKKETYRWYECKFTPFYDEERKRNIYIFSRNDITLRIDVVQSYEERLRSLLEVRERAVGMCTINLTKNTIKIDDKDDTVNLLPEDSVTFESVMMCSLKNIIGWENQESYRKLMSREYLLQQAADGNTHIQLEYLYQIEKGHYEWRMSVVELIQNPITEDYCGIVYHKSTQIPHMTKLLLEKALKQDYVFAAVIFTETDEFYLYNSANGEYSPRMQDYWEVSLKIPKIHCSEETLQKINSFWKKETILQMLEKNTEFNFAFDYTQEGKLNRFEIRFSYLDENHTMLMAAMRNITDSSLLERFKHDSEHDHLTDFYNRRTFIIKAEKMLQKYQDVNFAIIHIDVKNFHQYNTFFGEEAGDILLCNIAELIRETSNDYEYYVYARIEADVFCALVPYEQSIYEKQANKAAKTIRSYRDDFLVEPKFGVYFVEDRNMSVESMITRAALAANMVNANSVNATVYYDKTMEERMAEEQQIVNDMQLAIENEQYQVYLQAKYALRTNEPVGAEALVRWEHPEKGMIMPYKFIPVFEKNGFIMTLDRYMWEHVCKLLGKWKDEGKTLIPVSVNVSRISIYNPTTVSFLKNLVTKYGIEPRYLELELTESAYVENPEEIKPRLLELQKYGFKILMDDFGSGYSSLNALKDLPIDILKLDMKFLSDTENRQRGDMVLSAILRMSKLLKLGVIAEGVEEQNQADFLRCIGCEYVQGYLYARPIPVREFEENIMSQSVYCNQEEVIQRQSVCQQMLSSNPEMTMCGKMIPDPMVFIEYRDRQFSCMRVNDAFISAFGLENDLRLVSEIFREHLSGQEYERMLLVFEKCSSMKKSFYFRINWVDTSKEIHRYLVHASYEGNVGEDRILAVVFMEENAENLVE